MRLSKEMESEWRKVLAPLLNLVVPPFSMAEAEHARKLNSNDNKDVVAPRGTGAVTVDTGKTPKYDARGVPGAEHDVDVKSLLELNGKTILCKIGRQFLDNKVEIRSSSYNPDKRGCVLLKGQSLLKDGMVVSMIDHKEIDDLIYALLRARNHSFPKAPRFKA